MQVNTSGSGPRVNPGSGSWCCWFGKLRDEWFQLKVVIDPGGMLLPARMTGAPQLTDQNGVASLAKMIFGMRIHMVIAGRDVNHVCVSRTGNPKLTANLLVPGGPNSSCFSVAKTTNLVMKGLAIIHGSFPLLDRRIRPHHKLGLRRVVRENCGKGESRGMGRFATAVEFYGYREPYPPAFFESVAARVALTRSSRLLDVGCGPGSLALGFAPFSGSCTAVDREPAMVRAARKAAAEARLDITLLKRESRIWIAALALLIV